MVTHTADKTGPTFSHLDYRLHDRDGTAQGPERLLDTREDDPDQGIVEAARLASERTVAA